MTLRSLAASVGLLALMATGAHADCSPSPAEQPKATFPHLTGKLLYTTWQTDSKGARVPNTGQIAYYDFTTGQNVAISQPNWGNATQGMSDMLNPTLSEDEHWVLFMAITSGTTNNVAWSAWNVYMYRLGSNTAWRRRWGQRSKPPIGVIFGIAAGAGAEMVKAQVLSNLGLRGAVWQD